MDMGLNEVVGGKHFSAANSNTSVSLMIYGQQRLLFLVHVLLSVMSTAGIVQKPHGAHRRSSSLVQSSPVWRQSL